MVSDLQRFTLIFHLYDDVSTEPISKDFEFCCFSQLAISIKSSLDSRLNNDRSSSQLCGYGTTDTPHCATRLIYGVNYIRCSKWISHTPCFQCMMSIAGCDLILSEGDYILIYELLFCCYDKLP